MKRLLVICLAVVLALGLGIAAFSAQPTTSASEPTIEATVDFEPDTLWSSEGKWIPCYIELPWVYDVGDIDISSVTLKLADTVPALAKPTRVGDYDSDGVPDLQVRFERAAVQGIFPPWGEVMVTVSGEVDGELFEGRDMLGAMAAGVREKSTIIKRYGQGFLEELESGLRVLHLKGTAYERGYQRVVLQGDIEYITKANITGYLGYFGPECGDDWDATLAYMLWQKGLMEPYIPYQYQQEMQGMADALAAQGSDVTYDDLVLHVVVSDSGMMLRTEDLTQTPERNPPPPIIPHCGGFAAWGDATKDGSVVTGVIVDYSDTPEELEKRPIVVVDPTDGGYGYIAQVWSNFPVTAGLNEAGFALNGITGSVTGNTLRGVSTEVFLGLMLQYSDSIEDAVELVSMYPRAGGLKPIIADTKRGAVMEWCADQVAVRFNEPGEDAIWTGYFFACYPGFKGYEGFNMATVSRLCTGADISTIEKWLAHLETKGRGAVGKWGRYEQLINENYGEIDVEIAKEIVSDRYCMKEGRWYGPFEAGGRTLCTYSGCRVTYEDLDWYKSDRTGDYIRCGGSVGCMVATPATGDVWMAVAIGNTPGQPGMAPAQYNCGFHYFNIHDELARNR